MRRRYYEENVLSNVLSEVHCSGNEKTILDCNSLMFSNVCPTQESDAGVFCQQVSTKKANCSDGEIRLVNGSNVLEGRVEVCINQAWGTVCDSTFNQDIATIVCQQLGYKFNGNSDFFCSAHTIVLIRGVLLFQEALPIVEPFLGLDLGQFFWSNLVVQRIVLLYWTVSDHH